ncbi:Formation of crista junctions protein 1 [Podochytrium sp. JEL0797]|nr:Formation of crista junctions protein 1 [Podochytrium sp. JEL0797]
MKEQKALMQKQVEVAIRQVTEEKEKEFVGAVAKAVAIESDAIQNEWKQKVKQLVDAERDGRLAKLDLLAVKVKQVESIAVASGEFVERMQKVQGLRAAVNGIVERMREGQGFHKELAVLKKCGEGDAVVEAVVRELEGKRCEEGVLSLEELKHDFESLRTTLRRTQLMPTTGGPFAYLTSHLLSYLLIPKHGLVPGTDTESILARTRWYLSHGDLESAGREMNQVKGWGKEVAKDWVREVRRVVEVEQGVEVVGVHVELMNLGVV